MLLSTKQQKSRVYLLTVLRHFRSKKSQWSNTIRDWRSGWEATRAPPNHNWLAIGRAALSSCNFGQKIKINHLPGRGRWSMPWWTRLPSRPSCAEHWVLSAGLQGPCPWKTFPRRTASAPWSRSESHSSTWCVRPCTASAPPVKHKEAD